MRNILTVCTSCAVLALSPASLAQTSTDQKLEAEIAKLQVETEKAKFDTQKARIETDKALLSSIRDTSGSSATVTAGEKTVEGLLLSKASLAGASAKIVNELTSSGYPAGPDIKPIIIWGSKPPSVAEWLQFKEERERLKKQLKAANDAWASTKSTNKALLPTASVAVTLIATMIQLFKVDTTLAGGSVSFEENDARASLEAALRQANYGSFRTLSVTDGAALANELLFSLVDEHEAARMAYENEYAVNFEGRSSKSGPPDKFKAAGEKLKAALNAYRALHDQLVADTGGIVAASVIDRQRQLYSNPAQHPIIYILNVDAAYTSITKKGTFTNFTGGGVPAFGSATTIIDYAIAGLNGESRGTVACTIGNRPVKDLLHLKPETFAKQGTLLCDTLPKGK